LYEEWRKYWEGERGDLVGSSIALKAGMLLGSAAEMWDGVISRWLDGATSLEEMMKDV